MKKLGTLVLVMLLATSALLFAQGQKESSKSYVFAANCAWPPLEFVDENGVIVGFEIDLVNDCKVNNVKITIRNVAWEGILRLAKKLRDAVVG